MKLYSPEKDAHPGHRIDVRDVRIRAIRPNDWHRLQCFHRRLSNDTIEQRFHAAKRELSAPLAHYFTTLDGRDNVGLVATTGTHGRIIGVGRYNRISPHSAEVAFVVEDEYQHHGIGKRIAGRLRDVARQNGIGEFIAEILPGNDPMFHLAATLGPYKRKCLGGEYRVVIDLTAPCPPRDRPDGKSS